MRCPKCHYLSFEPEPRCRNCGYDLAVPDADLALRTEADASGPLDDLSLRPLVPTPAAPITLELDPVGRAIGGDLAPAEATAVRATAVEVSPVEASPVEEPEELVAVGARAPIERLARSTSAQAAQAESASIAAAAAAAAAPATPPTPARPIARAPHTTAELPLFMKATLGSSSPDSSAEGFPKEDDQADDQGSDEPLVTVPASPRAPLAVRRGALPSDAAGRARPKPGGRRPGPFDRDLLEDLQRVEPEAVQHARVAATAPERSAAAMEDGEVSPRMRLTAAAIDLGFTGLIGTAVVWATLRLCDVSLADVGWSALAPLAAFLLLVNVGYLVLFTAAGGQTLGKMALGIRVVGALDADVQDDFLSPGQAAWRALLTVPSVFVLGAGLWPALVGRGQALHDRIAGTRVVRA